MARVDFKFNCGDELRDKVTGLQGIVMVCASYATGCHHYGISPSNAKDGKCPDWEWIDQSRLEMVREKAVTFNLPEVGTSGAFPSGPQA